MSRISECERLPPWLSFFQVKPGPKIFVLLQNEMLKKETVEMLKKETVLQIPIFLRVEGDCM